ncbi:DapH/DapD/GlmU-related protein [Rubritalea tangerina]|uniref:DapH/DapD/GlmU-related protein n=1 Tax=Rubritalea tangerina TaxID=430798 RepID=A0ABW4ZA37_9BACT
MEAVIQTPHHESLCAPITSGHHIADILIGNIPLKDLMATELRRAGFQIVELTQVTPSTVHLPLDHWVEVGALCLLARETPGTCLYDSMGDIVAWKGCDEPDQCKRKIVTEADCFRMRYPWEILQVNSAVVEALPDDNILGSVSPLSEINGIVQLGEGSRILPGVVIEGNVSIGRNCRIGPNAYIRGNTSIGDDCIIGNAVEVKNSLIAHNTSIAHLSYVGDSVIGSHVNLGAGTILSNYRHDGKNHRSMVQGELIDTGLEKLGAIIGDGVRTGANTVIYPGRKIGNARTTLPGAIIKDDMM